MWKYSPPHSMKPVLPLDQSQTKASQEKITSDINDATNILLHILLIVTKILTKSTKSIPTTYKKGNKS